MNKTDILLIMLELTIYLLFGIVTYELWVYLK